MGSTYFLKISRMQKPRSILLSTYLFLISIAVTKDYAIASFDVLSHPCDSIKCPPLADLICPEDSEIRETDDNFTLTHDRKFLRLVQQRVNISEIMDELFATCCLQKKCICKACYIPDCFNRNDVVIELVPESMNTPGHCCGSYKCNQEPNCTIVLETEEYWLTNCKRCKCYAGERICHQICEEGIKKSTAICNSETLNTFFENGETWRDGCYECECVNGEEKCVMPFCRSLDCPSNRQVVLQGRCCPICWPMGVSMPHEDEYKDEIPSDVANMGGKPNEKNPGVEQNTEIYDDTFYGRESGAGGGDLSDTKAIDDAVQNQKPIDSLEKNSNTVAKSNTNDRQATVTVSPPCVVNVRQEIPATYQVYPEVIEVVRETNQSGLYILVGILLLAIFGLLAWNFRLRAKQRSYRPVCHFDDNFNKMTPQIKKTMKDSDSV